MDIQEDRRVSPVELAKDRLLAIGEESAAAREARRLQPGNGKALAVAGAVIGIGLMLAKRGSLGKTVLSLALLGKVAKPLLPILIQAALRHRR